MMPRKPTMQMGDIWYYKPGNHYHLVLSNESEDIRLYHVAKDFKFNYNQQWFIEARDDWELVSRTDAN